MQNWTVKIDDSERPIRTLFMSAVVSRRGLSSLHVEGAHDLGGLTGFGVVRTDDGDLHTHDDWELRAQLLALMACRGARAWIERIDPATYLATSYYGRWLLAGEMGAVFNGLLSQQELADWNGRIANGEMPPRVGDAALTSVVEGFMTTTSPMPPAVDPAFVVGDQIRVQRIYAPQVHHRVPRYLRGVHGVVETVCGNDRIAGHRDNEPEPLYTVRFASTDVWGASTEPAFAIYVDLWQSYLEQAA
jgi:nitrile hydratase subunit beta